MTASQLFYIIVLSLVIYYSVLLITRAAHI